MITDTRTAVVIPNLNGANYVQKAIDSLLSQTYPASIIVVENASTDNSLDILKQYGNKITIIENVKNLGFAGGVNTGIKYAMTKKYDAVALLNNDAVAAENWLEELNKSLFTNDSYGIATGKIKLSDKKLLDSTGEFYTIWGLPFPRGREKSSSLYTKHEDVFGASGGASIYRIEMLQKVGLFDETFFAYYEDTDISFRAQLAGWKVAYNPNAVVTHEQGATSKKMVKGFTVYQTFKNLPILFWKNVPLQLLVPIGIRFLVAYLLILGKATFSTNTIPALKGCLMSIILFPQALHKRSVIQKNKTVPNSYIRSILVNDLPPDQTGIRKVRSLFVRH